ncbi:MAG: SpoIIE family protein phosphatase [Clostridia bacterium]|nr:SpoIIE family protein phosphatase [Clostridia bacterium]
MEKNHKILIVDDNEINIDLIEAYLLQDKRDVHILKARDGYQALEVIEANEPDLVLLDVMMPGMDGYEVCRRIKAKEDYNLPVIMITALGDRKNMIKGLEAGADDFLTKPVDRHELLVRCNNLLKVKRLTDDLSQRYQDLKKEMEMARRLQQGFLPQRIPEFKELHIEVLYQTSIGVGGDFYDFLVLDDHSLGVFIGDVSGHGVSSAMITAVLKDLIAKGAKDWANPGKFLTYLNQEIYSFFNSVNSDHFVTAFYSVFNLKKNVIIYANAGHPAPIFSGEKGVFRLECSREFPLGLFDNVNYEEEEQLFSIGNQVFMFTDGLFELKNTQGEYLAEEVLMEEIKNNNDFFAYLRETINSSKGFSLDDDINIIKLKRTEPKESGG